MSRGPRIEVDSGDVQAKLAKLAKKMKTDKDVTVGFTANYAVYVHENLTARHRVGQAKFLEEPLRTLKAQIYHIIATVFEQTQSASKSLMAGGLFLQREAQKRVPVDTGALKNSAYTRLVDRK